MFSVKTTRKTKRCSRCRPTKIHHGMILKNALFTAVTEAIHTKTFELVRLTPDPEGTEHMSVSAVEHNVATALSCCRATEFGRNFPKSKFMQDLLQRYDEMSGGKLAEGLGNKGKLCTTRMILRN